jgi:hypothetical protein
MTPAFGAPLAMLPGVKTQRDKPRCRKILLESYQTI